MKAATAKEQPRKFSVAIFDSNRTEILEIERGLSQLEAVDFLLHWLDDYSIPTQSIPVIWPEDLPLPPGWDAS